MSNLWRFPWYLLLPVLVYGSALFISFAHHDQYRYFRVSAPDKASCAEDSQFVGLFYDMGRPITAFIECLQFKTVNSVQSLTWYRLLTLILIMGLAYLLTFIFEHRLKLGFESSSLLAAVICLLPGMLNFFVMTAAYAVLALILAALAYVLFELSPRGIAASFVLFTAALFTYPPCAFLMVALAFGEFLFSKGNLSAPFKRLLCITFTAVLASVLFYGIVKFWLHPLANYDERHPLGEGWGGATYAFRLSTDLGGRLRFFVQALNVVFNFWNIYFSSILTFLIAGWMLLLILWPFSKAKTKNWKVKLSVSFIGLIAVFAPLLFSNMGEIRFRTLISISIYALLVLVWLFNENFKIKRVPRWAFGIFVACLSGFHLIMTARNSALEFDYLKNQIKERQLFRNHILLVKNTNREQATVGINGLPSVTDEFNVNTTVFHQEENTFILRAALVEAGAGLSTRVYMCSGAADCTKAESAVKTHPNVYIMDKGNDLSGFPARFPVIDMEQFSR